MLRHTEGAAADSARLTSEELNGVLSDAIRRQSREQAELDRQVSRLGQVTSLQEAREIAQQLGVEERHVEAALREHQKLRRRGEKRALVRQQKRALGTGLLVVGTGIALGGLFLPLPHLAVLALAGLVAAGGAFLLFQAATGRISDAEADQAELLPVAGTCRVCGKPAYNERATFCAEHQYRLPGS